jgi:superfamily II DNA or RNA helicase
MTIRQEPIMNGSSLPELIPPVSNGALSLRPYQVNAINQTRQRLAQVRSVLINAPTGAGKCLGKGTPVLMYDGKIKAVEDVCAGDQLMGPDSTPRNVLSVCSGVEMLYRVMPKKGDSYVVNASHILSLKRTREGDKAWENNRAGDIVNIPVTEYLQTNPYFKHLHKGWRTGVEFTSRELLLIDPYFLGMWLGDGSQRHPAITTGDQEVIDWIVEYASRLKLQHRIEDNSENSINIHITTGVQGGGFWKNPLVSALDRHGLRQRKHVPHAYKTASRADRLKLLAGFIDADGSLSNGGYDVVGINEELIDDIIFVARSLGFAAYKSACKKTCGNNGKEGDYFRCNIGGDTDEIPCLIARKQAPPRRQKKSVLVTGIRVEPIGVGDYYGFEINGDRLFLLGDFTVTHNTIIGCQIIRQAVEKRRRVLFLAHRRELIDQCAAKLDEAGVLHHGVILSGHAKARAPQAPVQVASIQTLIRRELPLADLVIIDEAHRALAKSYQHLLANYPHAKIIGLTATPERLDGKGLADLFDAMVVVATIPDLINEGFLVAPECYGAPSGGPDLRAVKTQRGDYHEGQLQTAMDTKELTGELLTNWQRLAGDCKTIVFATGIAHSQHIVTRFQQAGVQAAHLDGSTPMAQRQQIIRDWRTGDLQVVSNCAVLTEGFDYPELECCVLARPTQSVAIYLQSVGRVMRPALGKARALVLDHAGCFNAHGLPFEHREWTLEGEAERRKRKKAPPKVCRVCQLAHEADESLFLQDSQPHLHGVKALERAKAALKAGHGIVVCPGCSMSECLICQAPFKAGSAIPQCPNCGATYGAEPEDEDGDGERSLPLESGEQLEPWLNSPANDRLKIKNEFTKLMNTAREKGYKRGWAFHKLKEKYGDAALEALPRHTGTWWRQEA